jgi:hypothetical protein
MIFIKVDDNNNITMTHYMPFDEKNGMHKTKAELLKIGYLVENIPEFEPKDGYYTVPKFDTGKMEFYCEYVEIPKTEATTDDILNAILGVVEDE